IKGLRIFARSTVLAFRDKQVAPAQVGQQLGAAYLLTGSLRRAGARLGSVSNTRAVRQSSRAVAGGRAANSCLRPAPRSYRGTSPGSARGALRRAEPTNAQTASPRGPPHAVAPPLRH